MDDLYDPAEVYGDEDTLSNEKKNGDSSDMDDHDNELHNFDLKPEECEYSSKGRFLRTEGSETKPNDRRLSPNLDALKNEDSGSESHVHKGCIFRLVIFNIPLCVTDVSRVQHAVQSVLDDDDIVEFVDGVYLRSAVVCIKPVSAVEKAAQKLTSIDDLPVIARKMTSKDYNIFLKKKEKAMSNEKPSRSLQKAEKEIPTSEDNANRSSPTRVTISNVSHSISAANLADTLKIKVRGIKDVVLNRPLHPPRMNRQHSGKGYVSFHSKADAIKFFTFHRMRIAGRDLIIHRNSTSTNEESFSPRERAQSVSSRREYRLKISNLSVEVSSQELQEIFAGEVNGRVRVSLGRSEDAPHSGCGVLVFETAQLAKMAHELMDGCDLGGSKILLQMDFDENETNEDFKPGDSNVQTEDKVVSSVPSDDFKNEDLERRQRDREHKQRDRDRRDDRERHSRESGHRAVASSERRLLDRQDRSRDRSRGKSRGGSHDRSRGGSRDRNRGGSHDKNRGGSRDRNRGGSQGRSRGGSHDKSRGGSHDKSRDGSHDKSRGGSHDKSRGGSHDKSRGGSHDKSRGGSRDRNRGGSCDRNREETGNSTRERSRDITLDKTQRRTRDRSQDKSRDRSPLRNRERTIDRSRGRSRDLDRANSRDRSMGASRDRSRNVHTPDMNYRRYKGVHIYTEHALFMRRSLGADVQLQFSNVAYNLPEEKLIDFVTDKCSNLSMVHFVRNKHGVFRGVALLEFKSRAGAVAAMKLKNTSLEGRKVVVKIDVDSSRPFPESRSPTKNDGPPRHLHRDMDIRGLPAPEPMSQTSPLIAELPGGRLEPHGSIMGGPHMGPNGPMMREPGHHGPMMGGPPAMDSPRPSGGGRGLLATPTNRGSFGGPVVTRDDIHGTQVAGTFASVGGPVGGSGDMTRGASSRGVARETSPRVLGHRNNNLMMRGMQQLPTNQMPPRAQQMNTSSADPSSETFGLSTAFLESLGITLPIVKEVLVMNVDGAATEDDLKELFSIAGTVVGVQYNQQHGQAVIEMAHPVEAVQSISMLHQQEYFDRIITVRLLRANDPENLVARAVVSSKPRGLKTIGRGLGIGGLPVSALPAVPPNSQPSNPVGLLARPSMQERTLNSLPMNADPSSKKNTRVSRWSGKDDQQDGGPNTSRFSGQNRSTIPRNLPIEPSRGAGQDFCGPQMSRTDNGNTNLDNRRFRERDPRDGFLTPQSSASYRGGQNRSFHSRGSTPQGIGRGNRPSDSPKFAESSISGWNQNRSRNGRGSSRGDIGQSNLDSRRNSGSSRGLLNANRGRGFGSRSGTNLKGYDNAQENASSGKIVILSNLPVRAHESAINGICCPFGMVKDIELNSNRRSCRVTFDNYQQASMAADILNNQDFIGSTISATMA
ncbi:RNA recognition motif domain [Trinorchestia longiramus]|nr:RNA recognition motif domain [Trinorchestia longiramus]